MNELIIPPMRNRIFALEAEMKKLPQIDIPVKHYFSPGLYAREITVPETAIITGVIHKYPQINILSKGTMLVTIGEEVRQVTASHTVVSPPGVKRAAVALTECVWTTIVHTFLTDVDEIEKKFFAYTQDDYDEFVRQEIEQQQWLA